MADRTIIQKPVTTQQLAQLTILLVAGEPSLLVTYYVVDDNGRVIGTSRVHSFDLTPDQIRTIQDFVSAVVLPVINSIEGTEDVPIQPPR